MPLTILANWPDANPLWPPSTSTTCNYKHIKMLDEIYSKKFKYLDLLSQSQNFLKKIYSQSKAKNKEQKQNNKKSVLMP